MRWGNKFAATCVEVWHAHMIGEKQMRAKALKAVKRIMNATLVQGFEVWKDKTTEEKKMQANALKLRTDIYI
jgi:hypothetical protein